MFTRVRRHRLQRHSKSPRSAVEASISSFVDVLGALSFGGLRFAASCEPALISLILELHEQGPVFLAASGQPQLRSAGSKGSPCPAATQDLGQHSPARFAADTAVSCCGLCFQVCVFESCAPKLYTLETLPPLLLC